MSTGPPGIVRPSRATLPAAVLVAVASVAFLAGPVGWAAGNIREGFPGYYTAARLVLEERWSPRVYDDTWFARETLTATSGRLGEIYRPNPPVASLIFLPFAGFDVTTARRAWLAVEVVLVIAAWLLFVAAIPSLRAPPLALGFLALALAWTPLGTEVLMGQVYLPLLALHAGALLGLRAGRGRGGARAAIALGAAVATKLAAIPWLLALLVRGERRAVVVAIGTAAALAALTIGFAGWDGWTTFATTAWHDLTADRPSLAVTAYQSTAGLLRHLLAPDATWNPGAVANLPLVARGLGLAVSAWVVLVTVLVARRGRPDLVAGIAVSGGLLALNVAQEYAYTLLLLPAAVALGRCTELTGGRGGRWRTTWLAVAIALLAAPLPYRNAALDDGWLALLAYPRVYGAWLLWAWLAREIGRDAVVEGSGAQRAAAVTR